MSEIKLILDEIKQKAKNEYSFRTYIQHSNNKQNIILFLKQYYKNVILDKDVLYLNLYYYNYNKDFSIPKCPICNKEVKYNRGVQFYDTCCGKECIYQQNLKTKEQNKKQLNNIEEYLQKQKEKYNINLFSSSIIGSNYKDNILNYLKEKYNNIKTKDSIYLYLYYYDIKDFSIPKCPICNKERKHKFGLEYYDTCGDKKCTRQHIEKTNIIKYGYKTPLQNSNIKEQIKQTNIKKYNTESYTKTKEYREKTKKTCLEKYNTEHHSSSPDVINKYKKTRLKNKINKFKKLLNEKGYTIIDKYCVCNKCRNVFSLDNTFIKDRILLYDNIICPYCFPKHKYSASNSEKELLDFIKELLPNEHIKENYLILDKHEIDVYIPYLKIGFEYNGLYWHSEIHKDKYYHRDKSKLAAEKGIRLIHVWEDDWIYKNEIVKSRIKNILNKTEKRVYGRNTEVKEINFNDCKQFLDENHIQGCGVGNIRYGLFFGDELVSVIQVDKSGLLSRFANKLNTNVIGGFSKLFKHCEKYIKYTFIDLDWSSENNIYNRYMKFDSYVEPTWYLIVNKKRHHRRNFQKKKLLQMGLVRVEQTEHEITLSNKLYRIYNSGNIKYVKKEEI